MTAETMIERIGQILHRHVHGEKDGPVALSQAEIEAAIAILNAMREPTSLMEEVGDEAAAALAETQASSGADTWHVMIDMALREH